MCENVHPRSGMRENSVSLRPLRIHLAISFFISSGTFCLANVQVCHMLHLPIVLKFMGRIKRHFRSYQILLVIEDRLSGLHLKLNYRKPFSLDHCLMAMKQGYIIHKKVIHSSKLY